MLFLPSHHYPQTLTKGPNLPVPLNLCFKMKDISNEGSFLIPLFTERRRERQREGGRNRGKKGALEPHFPSCSPVFVFFRPWATCWRRRQISEKIPRVFLFPSNQPAPSSPIFWQRRRGQKGEGEKKKQGETWLKERTRKRGPRRQLLERLVRDFQPLTSVVASSPTWSRQGPEQARGPIWKGTGPSLILWRNCLQVGPSIPQ